ncbi:YciI family protein [Singulisphaera sp. GP187]|uniref:YciI family protein n=1 Tax=Singulisphaera sp. GP187 TaxID=1882752 RepID=UPI0039657C68
MRYMMMFKADKNTEAGILPDKKVFDEMGKAMGAMAAAGVLINGEGLQPSSKGARVQFSQGKRIVTDGPFAETKELICGYVIVQVDSKEEAIEWAKRGLKIHGDGESEARQVFQASDFGAEFTPELREAEERMREQIRQSSK